MKTGSESILMRILSAPTRILRKMFYEIFRPPHVSPPKGDARRGEGNPRPPGQNRPRKKWRSEDWTLKLSSQKALPSPPPPPPIPKLKRELSLEGRLPLPPDLGPQRMFDVPEPHFGMLRIRENVHPILKVLLGLLPFLLVGIWWMFVTKGSSPEYRLLPPTVLPSPAETFGQVGELMEGGLIRNILVSLFRVLSGFTIAALIAVPLGVMMGASTKVRSTFGTTATVLSYLPVPAIVPLTIAWWGTGEKQKIGFLALVVFAILLPSIIRCVTNVDHKYVLSAYSQGASPWQVVRHVLWPVALPDIYQALRTCLGIGWTYIVLVEVMKTGKGLGGVGNLIMVHHRLGHIEEVYLIVVAIMIVGFILDRSIVKLGNVLFPYRRDR